MPPWLTHRQTAFDQLYYQLSQLSSKTQGNDVDGFGNAAAAAAADDDDDDDADSSANDDDV